jgi:hypothetical protein
MIALTPMQGELCRHDRWDFSDLRALFVNRTLKRSPERSHTQGLIDISMEVMRRQGVSVDMVRAVDHDIATGGWPDMTEHGWQRDEWPAIFEQVQVANILVVCTPIWLGEKSSVCTTFAVTRKQGTRSAASDLWRDSVICPMRRFEIGLHPRTMAVFLLEHRHEPVDCAAAFAAWKGVESPLRGTTVLCSCPNGAHRLWFVVDAPDELAALAHLPHYLAERAIATQVARVPIP